MSFLKCKIVLNEYVCLPQHSKLFSDIQNCSTRHFMTKHLGPEVGTFQSYLTTVIVQLCHNRFERAFSGLSFDRKGGRTVRVFLVFDGL